MAIEIRLAARTVARSRNLRGILTYARKHYVREATCNKTGKDEGFAGDVYIRFNDGAECRTRFADYSVLLNWIRARRSWDLHEIYCSPDRTSFTLLCGDVRY